ncbi:wiskott-Aldrich syndrome protein family member 1-like [Sorghum bicolor]|uniref:wiskott-Aldrich syndrome protein family member 1-like n=1 Tax=Sorghum bicolor TaxID=4558 RepID=UPI000B424408|nr:wiskott-Aldrich syndrome protein family member 1-like [Sorghum bicolor]|eukprot:XP_021308414.1 wiskott-Aldrich syndrome protein family member 1-like [Sorghum bicolor]
MSLLAERRSRSLLAERRLPPSLPSPVVSLPASPVSSSGLPHWRGCSPARPPSLPARSSENLRGHLAELRPPPSSPRTGPLPPRLTTVVIGPALPARSLPCMASLPPCEIRRAPGAFLPASTSSSPASPTRTKSSTSSMGLCTVVFLPCKGSVLKLGPPL